MSHSLIWKIKTTTEGYFGKHPDLPGGTKQPWYRYGYIVLVKVWKPGTYMGQYLQDGGKFQYSSIFCLKGKAGVGWEMKVSKVGQVLPFQNGLLI